VIALPLYRLPAVYPFRFSCRAGGCFFQGRWLDALSALWHQSSVTMALLDEDPCDCSGARLLCGCAERNRVAKPSDLPVEQPIKYDFTINLKTAKAFGFTFLPSFHLRADEVIE
jgi:hypothetical protein